MHPTARSATMSAALALVAGCLHAACFPPVGLWPLAPLAIAMLVVAVRGRGTLGGAALGWLAGTVASLVGVVPWAAVAVHRYFGLGPTTSTLAAAAAAQLFGVLSVAAFAATLPRIADGGAAPVRVLATAGAWTALELARSRLLTGAPWDLLGHAVYASPLWIQVADLGGVYVVSFVLVAVGAAAAELVLADRREAAAAGVLAAALVVATAGYGGFRLRTVSDDDGPALRVGLVQGSVPASARARGAEAAFDALAATTRSAVALRPDLIVWPENAMGFLLGPNPRFGRALADLLGPGGPPLLLGGPREAAADDGRVRFFNSAQLLSSSGIPLAVYDKRHLVPFTEYHPLRAVPGDYTPGASATVFQRPDRFGALICFEAIYPALARDLVRSGARFLVNVSNDEWLGEGAGREQHFAMTVFRAVETRRALVRVANTGVTAVVGPSGRVRERFPPDVRAAWVVRVPLRDGTTPYACGGDLFAWLAACVAALVVVRGSRGLPA